MDETLPAAGEVYWVETWLFLDGDPKDDRAVVVVRPPRNAADLIVVVERTTTRFDLRGIEHPKDLTLGLDEDGKWIHRFTRSVQASLFMSSRPRLTGRLGPPYLEEVIRMWEEW